MTWDWYKVVKGHGSEVDASLLTPVGLPASLNTAPSRGGLHRGLGQEKPRPTHLAHQLMESALDTGASAAVGNRLSCAASNLRGPCFSSPMFWHQVLLDVWLRATLISLESLSCRKPKGLRLFFLVKNWFDCVWSQMHEGPS